MKETSEENLPKEAVGEDWCFVCYEGGDLRICDYKGCFKSYHNYCVEKDEAFLKDEGEWFCASHICCICGKSSNVHCLCCPTSVCRHCIVGSDVVETERGKGFCSKCLTLALMIEEDKSEDSDGNHVDFYDLRTDEGLFKEYWDIINKEEGVTLETLRSADLSMRKGSIKKKVNKRKKHNKKKSSPDFDKHNECEETEISDYDDSSYAKKRKSNQKLGRSKNQMSAMKRKVTRPEFIGWGSKSLVKFLESINVDVSESLSPRNVASIVNRYIRDNKLFHPDKKKQVVCDVNLQSLFKRKTLNKHKISHYLDSHFAENQQSSSDEIVDVSEDENSFVSKRQRKQSEYRKVSEDEKSLVGKRKKIMSEYRKFEAEERFSKPQRRYASICPANINLVYLKRTLVQKLLEEPDTLGVKLTGSFVKVKSDPNDYLQTKPHQLMKVIGTTRDSTDENNLKVLLKVSGSTKPISINTLLESDITEEDCEGFKQCIKGGLVKQPTIAELKDKAIDLHEERMKHWIARELKLLQNRIDQANEKGWRKELYEYWEAQEKLQTSKERLLKHIPDVIAADLSELDYMPEGSVDDKEDDDSSHKSGSGKEHQRSEIDHCIPCTPTLKQKLHEAMGVHIVDFSDVSGKTRNAATQTQELEDPEGLTYDCISPDGQKVPFSLESLDQLKRFKSPSSDNKVCRAGDSEKNAIPLDAVDFSENQK